MYAEPRGWVANQPYCTVAGQQRVKEEMWSNQKYSPQLYYCTRPHCMSLLHCMEHDIATV